MPKTRPLQQQRKRRVRISKEAAFPVPIAAVTGETASNSHWIYYTAVLSNSGVTVHHSGDMEFLYRMGFFGKGSMSRGQPQWAECQRVAALPVTWPHSGGWQGLLHARVTSRRRYMTHLKWHLLSTGDEAGLTKAEDDLQVTEEEPTSPSDQCGSTEPGLAADVDNTENEEKKSADKMDMEEEMEEESVESMYHETEVKQRPSDTDWGEGEGDAEFWGTGDAPVAKTSVDDVLASWDNAEGDAEFWGTEDTDSKRTSSGCSHRDSSPCDQCGGDRAVTMVSQPVSTSPGYSVRDQQKHASHTACETERTADLHSVGHTAESVVSENTAAIQQSDPECSILNSSENKRFMSKQLGNSALETSVTRSSPSKKNMETNESENNVENTVLSEKESSLPCNKHENVACESVAGKSSADGDAGEPTTTRKAVDVEAREGSSDSKAVCASADDGVVWSEFCQDDAGNPPTDQRPLLVIADSDEEERTAGGQVCRTKTKWKPVVKADPFPVREHLHLSSEEAFFLSYGLGCLTVLDTQKTAMGLHRLWEVFCQRQSDFLPHYVAYHYYRSKNWVPKTGLKFGCTFLLYKDGPPFYHGSYSVVVRFVDAQGKVVEGFGKERQFSWTSLAGLKRITEHVGKELMMCYVIKPLDMTPHEMLSPACIPRFQVKEVLVSRWVSSQEREKDVLDDLP